MLKRKQKKHLQLRKRQKKLLRLLKRRWKKLRKQRLLRKKPLQLKKQKQKKRLLTLLQKNLVLSHSVGVGAPMPEATIAALDALKATSVRAVVIGTTGFTDAQDGAIQAAASRFAIVKAGNFSLGVNLLQALTRLAASRLGTDWDIEILESHHRLKVDAPSGTALMLGEAAAEGRGKALKDVLAAPYLGTDAARKDGEIGMAVRRAGGIYGEHEVLFGSPRELLRLSHVALDRAVFAEGAIHAATWAADQKPGLYGMDDVLGLGHTS